jgi:hypothetical protein
VERDWVDPVPTPVELTVHIATRKQGNYRKTNTVPYFVKNGWLVVVG